MDGSGPSPDSGTNRIWSFAGAEYEEARRELRVGGVAQTVEARPLAVLQELLARSGEVATRQELLDVVWQNTTVTDQSLTTAVAKLRTALGSEGRTIIEAVHGIGYRIGVPIELRAGPERPRLAFTLRAGDPVPNRPQWCLDRAFGNGQNRDVWLARHAKTGEQRVFKLADTEERLNALKREAALSRILHKALGERPDLVRVSEWNFEARPYFLESAYGGPDLVSWALARGGLAALPLADRVGMVADIARTVAAAHGVGVLHRDIKPTNILVADPGPEPAPDARPSLRLVDFGSGRLTEAARAKAVTVTGLGLTAGAAADGERISGTLRYMAPEIQAGGPPTIAGDVYALGILLYQMIVGDFDRPLVAGWENDVADPLLRDDIAAAASGDPTRRLASATILADRLDTLDTRRTEHSRLLLLAAEAERLSRKLERNRARRPWLILAAASLVLGLLGTSVSAFRASRARDEAERQSQTILAINQFLTDDLLGRGNPALSGNANETLMQAAEAAEPMIEQRLARQPMLAASIYVTLTKAFDGRGAFDASRHAYDRAEAILTQTEGANSADVVILMLRRAGMETIAAQPGSLEKGKAIISIVAPRVERLATRQQEARAWLLWARGQAQVLQGDMEEAQKDFVQAAGIAETLPQAFDPQELFSIRNQYGYSLLKSGRLSDAEAVFNRLAAEQTLLHGPMHPNVLLIDLNLAAVAVLGNHPDLAVQRVDKIYPALRDVFGPLSRKTVQAQSLKLLALLVLGRFEEVDREGILLYQQGSAAFGKTSWLAFYGLGAAGNAECRAGHTKDGIIKIREVVETSRATLGDASAITQSMKAALSECLVLDGQPIEAGALLSQIDCRALAGMTGQTDYCADVDILRAAIALKANDRTKTQHLLAEALTQLGSQLTDPFYKRWAEQLQTTASKP